MELNELDFNRVPVRKPGLQLKIKVKISNIKLPSKNTREKGKKTESSSEKNITTRCL